MFELWVNWTIILVYHTRMMGFKGNFYALLVKVLMLLWVIIWYGGLYPIHCKQSRSTSFSLKQDPNLIPIEQSPQPWLQNILAIIAHSSSVSITERQNLVTRTYFSLIAHFVQGNAFKILFIDTLPPSLRLLQTTHKSKWYLPWILVLRFTFVLF